MFLLLNFNSLLADFVHEDCSFIAQNFVIWFCISLNWNYNHYCSKVRGFMAVLVMFLSVEGVHLFLPEFGMYYFLDLLLGFFIFICLEYFNFSYLYFALLCWCYCWEWGCIACSFSFLLCLLLNYLYDHLNLFIMCCCSQLRV